MSTKMCLGCACEDKQSLTYKHPNQRISSKDRATHALLSRSLSLKLKC